MIDVAPFHLQLVEFCRCFVVSIGIIPVLDEVLLEFVPYVYVGRGQYRSSHDPIFDAMFPFGHRGSLYKGEGVCYFSVGVIHEWGIQIEELVEF